MSTILTAQANTENPTVDLEQVPPRRRRRHGRVYRSFAALLVAFGLAFGGMSAFAPEAQAATFGNVFVVATASYDCGSHQIWINPMTNENLNGHFSVYSQASVFDRVSGKWITTTGWMLDDGITSHVFYNFRYYDPIAKVTYARFMNGRWVYAVDAVRIVPTLDSMGPFCNP